jgi:hypothetical protein
MKPRSAYVVLIAFAALAASLSAAAPAQDIVTVDHCPGPDMLPVTFQIDCTHVANPQAKADCRPFAENQACKVFFAYRKITGFNLEQYCQTFKYTLYDKDQWPHQGADVGGLALNCGADLMTDSLIRSPIIGPYDVHEMLHVYQDRPLGALPDAHILFGPAMAEAQRLIGDGKSYWDAMSRLKMELNRTANVTNPREASLPTERQCVDAEFYIEDSLYVKNTNNVYEFYRKLGPGRLKDMNDRLARFNRMFDAVSGGAAKQYLVAHGCAAF